MPFEDSIGALVELRDEGKLRHIGLSNVNRKHLATALAITPIASVQNRYNPTDRSSERVLEMCEEHGIAFLPWGPISVDSDAHRRDRVGADDATHAAGRAGVAARTLAGHAPDPGHVVDRAPRRERGGRATSTLSDDDIAAVSALAPR